MIEKYRIRSCYIEIKMQQDFHSSKRRSLFDFENEDAKVSYKFSKEKFRQVHPVKYIDKVRREIAQLSLKLREAVEEKRQCKITEKTDLKTRIYSESNLHFDQEDFLRSVNLDGYLERVQDFCTRMIIMDRHDSIQGNELKLRILETEKRIEIELLQKHLQVKGLKCVH